MENDLLLMGDGMGDDAGAPHFRAGSRRGRNRDDRRNLRGISPRPPIADVLKLENRDGLAVHEGNHLADIKARAAAKGDHAVMAPRLIGLDALKDIGFNRIGPHIGEHRDGQSGALHVFNDGMHHGHGRQARIGHEQRAHDAVGLAELGQFLDPAHAKFERRRIAEIAVWYGHSFVLK